MRLFILYLSGTPAIQVRIECSGSQFEGLKNRIRTAPGDGQM